MRTTIDIPDPTYRELKARAATEGATIAEIALDSTIVKTPKGESEEGAQRTPFPVICSKNPGSLQLERVDDLMAGWNPVSDAGQLIVIPPSLASAARKLADEDGVSLDQWFSLAVAQKIGSAETVADFFGRRAERAEPERFLEILRSAPSRAPDPGDELE
jgi:hypothetical protein